jgi:small basic protein (TIGR04137 family)
MSLHRSLKTKPSALNQHRNVLTRAERITKLTEEGRFTADSKSPLGLAKVASRQIVTGKKKKEKEEEGAEAAVAAPAAAAKPAGKK